MNINTGNWRISRRTALRGLGATIALPKLDCMAEVKTVVSNPKRTVFLYIPNGVNTLTWQIRSAGPDYELTGPLKALQKHRSEITPISGLHHPNGLGKHHNCDKVWLTGADVPRDGGAFRNTVSIDQLIAEVQGPDTRFASLEMAVSGHSLAWSREGIQLPAERNSRTIFERLFGVEKEGKDVIRRRFQRRKSVLDVVLEDAKAMSKKVGAEDRTKLDEYLTAVRQVEVRTERADSWLDIPKPEIDAVTVGNLTRKVDQRQAGEYYRLYYDLITLALRTDMTRVITCMIGSESNGLAIPEIGVVQTRHELSHHNGDPEQMRRLTETDTFLIENYAYFLDQLKEVKEGDASLLDSTQVLWGSGMAYGHSHGNANLPTILAGGKDLGIKHGQHVDFNLPKIGAYDVSDAKSHYKICSSPVDSDARLANLLLTMGQRAGVEVDQFQDSLTTIGQIVV
ncbi:MAG: DUF1552 domain-containing protein [Verrucomicrobiales bacterium]|nr:DUF1552 domain-containing protein [Verrucomicrobiales bacterium]